MQRISSRRHAAVEVFRSVMETPSDRLLLVDGVHLVREAHLAGLDLTLAIADRLYESDSEAGALARQLEAAGVDIYVVTEPVMRAMSPVRTPSGVVAVAARRASPPAHPFDHPKALVVAPVDVQDPGNLGAVIRTAEALGGTGVCVCGASANPWGWKALRGSMGSAFRLPITTAEPPPQLLAVARQRGVRPVAAVAHGGVPPGRIDWSAPTVLFIGGEGPGLPDEVAAPCDERTTIPLTPPVESLNVAVAAALLLDEARRQRT